MNIFIFHGTASNPEQNWFPWLKSELEQFDCKVIIPQFPTPKGESLDSWFEVLDKFSNYIDTNTIIIGHSKGGLFLLKLLEKLDFPIKAAFMVSAPIGIKPILYYKEDLRFCKKFAFNFPKIKNNAKQFFIYHSDNDPYVSLDNGIMLSKNLNVKLNFIPNAGHLNAESGYLKFPELLEKLKSQV